MAPRLFQGKKWQRSDGTNSFALDNTRVHKRSREEEEYTQKN
jgi:hypothetical protein